MPTLLVEATEAWLMLCKRGECVQCLGDAAQEALGNGHEQQRIPLTGRCSKNLLACGQRFGKFPLPDQPPDANQFGRKRRCCRSADIHGHPL